VPDVRSAGFKAEAHRQALAVAQSAQAHEDQAFVDDVSAWDDAFDATASIAVCLLTTDPTEAPLFRLVLEPDDQNGLKAPSRIMVDKVVTVAKDRLGSRIGRMSDSVSLRLNQALAVFLGLAMSPRARSR